MRKKSVLIILAVLALGLFGTGLSTLYTQNELIGYTTRGITFKVSYGFPLGWYGYSTIAGVNSFWETPPHEILWFSLGSLLLDALFWFAISSLVIMVIMKSVNLFHKRRGSKNLSVINIWS